MAYYSYLNKLFFVFIAIALTVSNPQEGYRIDVNIFLEESNVNMRNIVQEAVERYQFDHSNSLSEKAVHLNLRLVRYNKASAINSIFTLDQDRFFNLTESLCSAIFVQTSNHELVLSSLMEISNIATIGLFQTSGILWTQESPAYFTRITSPSMMYYACVMRDVVKKMGWRTLSLMLSADYEGKVFADEMLEYSKKEKWDILHTVWISRSWGNRTELKSMFKQIMTNDSDAVIVHVRDSHNDELFRLVESLGVNRFKASWLLTDITTLTVSVVNLPVGFVRISPWRTPEHDFIVNALYDAFHLIELSAKDAVNMSRDKKTLLPSINNDSKALQRLFKRRMQDTFLQGKTSLFENPALRKAPFSTTDISNLKQDLTGHKHWTSVGLRTYSGIAIQTLSAPNGKVLFPRLVPSRPTLRVPVILYPPWVEAEQPQETYDKKITCLKRGYFCYNTTGKSITKLCCFGFSMDLLKILERELRFVPEIYLVADGQYGNFDENTGKWSGIVHELVSGKGDLALDTSLSGKRAEYIEFLFPYLPLALSVLVKKEGRSVHGIEWYSWLKPFDVWLWLTILGTCNVILLVIWWLDRKSPTGYYHYLKESNEDGFTMLDAMSYVWGVAFSKDIGAEKTPRSISARCVSTAYAFMALIIVNTYCANLMAFLVHDEFVLPIKGIKDPKLRDPSFYPPNGFQLGIQQGTFAEMYFKNHINYEFRQLYNTNLKINLMAKFSEGMNQLEKGEIHGLIADYLSLRQAANKLPGCRYCMAGPNFYTHGVGIAVPKGSPWLDDITQVILEMKANGSINMLEKMYFDEKICTSSVAKNLTIANFSGLFLTVADTIVFCFLALLAEVFALFVLVRFSQHLGVIGKFSMRLLFDLKKGEEHLIALKYSTMKKKRKIVKMDLIRIDHSSSNATSNGELPRNSINAPNDLEDLQPRKGYQLPPVESTNGILNESFESISNSHHQKPLTNSDLHNDSLSSEVTFL